MFRKFWVRWSWNSVRYFSRRFFIPISVCFNIDSINFDFKKGKGSIWVSESKEKQTDSSCFSEDIGMEFGIENCVYKSVGIELQDGKVIKLLQEGESYKYLGILEADKFLEEKMKLMMKLKMKRRWSSFWSLLHEVHFIAPQWWLMQHYIALAQIYQ